MLNKLESQPDRRIPSAVKLACVGSCVGCSRTLVCTQRLGSHQPSLRETISSFCLDSFCWQHCDGAIEICFNVQKQQNTQLDVCGLLEVLAGLWRQFGTQPGTTETRSGGRGFGRGDPQGALLRIVRFATCRGRLIWGCHSLSTSRCCERSGPHWPGWRGSIECGWRSLSRSWWQKRWAALSWKSPPARTWPLLSAGLPQSCECRSRPQASYGGPSTNLAKKFRDSRTVPKQGRLGNMNLSCETSEWSRPRSGQTTGCYSRFRATSRRFCLRPLRGVLHLSHGWGC